ncbi:hypothetical protein PG994_002292 [Apiospora phragmitis]|uniref:Glycosyltransferase family 25 protein n=1 Tax=Apiospora phragmitis TaxID=2905665 RepID=A0ABR1WVY9_9PEZI
MLAQRTHAHMASTWVRKAADWAKRRWIVLSAVFLLVPILVMYRAYSTSDVEAPKTWRADRLKPVQVPASAPSVVEAVTNATLGFEKLLVLSVRPSWRTRGLEAAAHLTGLDFTILPQTPSPDELVHAFQQQAQPKGLGLETALIVEDDLDWDVGLRTRQMRLVVDHVRNFTGVGPDDDRATTGSPYGDAWDVLWLGHCGAEMRPVPPNASALGWAHASLPYFDPLRLNGTGARPHWGFDTIGWKGTGWQHPPAGIRLVQDGGAVCSWAYAVSRRSAEKVLARMSQGDNQAFDIGLKDACDNGDLACVTVVPGVLSSYSPPADLGYQSPVRVGDGKGTKGDEAQFEGVRG